MARVTHLLVDLDGTLIEGDRIGMRLEFISRTLKDWRRLGSTLQCVRAYRQMKNAVESSPDGNTNELKMIRAFAEVFQISEAQARKSLEDSLANVFPKLQRHFTAMPGAQDFVHWAKTRYPLILATNPIWSPTYVEARVSWAGFDLKEFRSFTHAQRMHSCKPSLEYYREILEQEGLKAENCLLLGNDRRYDLPANQIGIRVFLLNRRPGAPVSQIERIPGQDKFADSWSGTYLGLKSILDKNSS